MYWTEESLRFSIFRDNMKTAHELNENELGTARYGATQFADLTSELFISSGSKYVEPFLLIRILFAHYLP